MDGIKIAAGVVFTGVLAASFYAVGVDGRDGRQLSTQAEFQQEAKTLLQKSGYTPGAVTAFDYSDTSEVAQLQYSFKNGNDAGVAYIGCSGSEVLQDGTHCQIGSIILDPANKVVFGL